MDISVLFEGKKYKFCSIGDSKKWVDNKNIVVPMVLDAILKKIAVDNGIDPRVFSNNKETVKSEEEERNKRTRVSSRKRQGSVTGGLSLSSLIPAKGETNGKE